MAKKVKEQGSLAIHSENIFPIIKKWLYSDREIFLRELISNAVDALNKRKRFDSDVKKEDLEIEVKADKKKKIIQIIDTGVGMTEEEVKKYINQIAFSGAEDFVEKFKDKKEELIGHFGLGFYSAFMVADKVTIDTLSYQKDSEPVYWECEGETSYKLGKGKRKKVGTTITLHILEDSEDYLEDEELKSLIKKYSNFMPFPIKIGKDTINDIEALWNRKPADITDEEYKEFYKKTFNDFQDPLFWIHLNVDFPFDLRGILYFPKVNNHFDVNRGEVKLFCNNVFVADNLKDIIPEFLLLLRGGIDIPEIPLNVSRSFLQSDKQVKKISKYIIKKVSDSLKEMFKEDREKYEKYWENIKNFIKYGIVTEDKFAKSMTDYAIFKTAEDKYVTIDEYLENNDIEDENKKKKIYYTSEENTQVTYLNLMKSQDIDVIYADSVIDNHFFQSAEMKKENIRFVRIDSELNDNIVSEDKEEVVDQDNKTESDKIKELFEKFYDNEQINIEVKKLKSKEIPGMIIFDENMRRFQEMNSMMTQESFDMLANHKFIVNADNETVKKIMALGRKGKEEKASLLAKYVHDLAMLEQKQFKGKKLEEFIKNTNKILDLV